MGVKDIVQGDFGKIILCEKNDEETKEAALLAWSRKKAYTSFDVMFHQSNSCWFFFFGRGQKAAKPPLNLASQAT